MLARRAEQGLPTPSWDKRPVLFDDLAPIWAAFWTLSAGRDAGLSGANPIRASDILAHLEIDEVSRGERSDWYSLIRFLDGEYLAEGDRRRKEKRKAEEAKRHGNAQSRDRRP